MKIKEGFVKQQLGDTTLLVSAGQLSREFKGMIELNYTAADIWDWLAAGKTPAETAALLAEKYGISPEKATADTEKLIAKMRESGVIEDG